MPFQIIRNDITKVKADAIVNTANPMPRIGSGTESAIYAAAGEAQLLAARERIGMIAPGTAAFTEAFGLDARVIIHTVGPLWIDGRRGERETLRACYRNCLALADSLRCASIAFPLISAGNYGFPKGEALHIALSEIQQFLLTHEMTVTIVVFNREAMELSESLMGGIERYIDDHTASRMHLWEHAIGATRPPCFGGERREEAYDPARVREEQRRERWAKHADAQPAVHEAPYSRPAPMPAASAVSLDEMLSKAGESFQQRLFELIDERGLDDVTVYKRANIDRKLFSRIRCKPDYRPKKKTALAFAIALELDMPTVTDLLSRAEIALSPSSTFDLIISYFINNRIYDIYEINAALFKYGQPILGE